MRQIFEKPNAHEDCQAKWIREFVKTKANGKKIYRVGGLTTASYIDVCDIPKSLFGSPYKRIYQEYTINNGKEAYYKRVWSVIKDAYSRKYIIDNYFASRILKFLCHLKGMWYTDFLRKTGITEITGEDVIGFLKEIKTEIKRGNKKAFDGYGVPKISIEYLNALIKLLEEEFELKRPIKLVRHTNRQELSEKTAIDILKEQIAREFAPKETVDEYTDQDSF